MDEPPKKEKPGYEPGHSKTQTTLQASHAILGWQGQGDLLVSNWLRTRSFQDYLACKGFIFTAAGAAARFKMESGRCHEESRRQGNDKMFQNMALHLRYQAAELRIMVRRLELALQ